MVELHPIHPKGAGAWKRLYKSCQKWPGPVAIADLNATLG
jgi:hypothetical protein